MKQRKPRRTGWFAAAHQVFYPDFYGGAFASCPDSVDFNYHQIVNIYKDANAYYTMHDWMKVDRPTQRRPDGNIVSLMKDENHYELTVGDKSYSYFSLPLAEKNGLKGISRLPVSMKVVLENLLRFEDSRIGGYPEMQPGRFARNPR